MSSTTATGGPLAINSDTTTFIRSTNPYAPQEPSSLLFLEHCSYVGNVFSAIAYGVPIVLFFRCLYTLLHPHYTKGNGRQWPYVVYCCVIFTLGTVFVALNHYAQQTAYIDNRNYPGGPAAYSLEQYWKPILVITNACGIVSAWLADALLMYRCCIIHMRASCVLILPSMLFCASIATGIITLYKASRPESNLWSHVTVNFGLPYFAISIANNVLLTLLISARLLLHRRRLRRALGDSASAHSPYVSIVAMLIESSALYAVLSILFIGPYAADSFLSDLFLPILGETQVIAPLLIIMRVAERRAWTSDTGSELQRISTIAFGEPGLSSENRYLSNSENADGTSTPTITLLMSGENKSSHSISDTSGTQINTHGIEV